MIKVVLSTLFPRAMCSKIFNLLCICELSVRYDKNSFDNKVLPQFHLIPIYFCLIYHYPFHQLALAFIVQTTANQWLYLDYIVNVVWLEVSKLYTTRNHILCGEPWNGMKRKYPGNMSLMCNKNTSILWLTFVES